MFLLHGKNVWRVRGASWATLRGQTRVYTLFGALLNYSDLAGQLGSSCGSAKKMGGEIIIVRTLGSSKKKLVDLPTEKNWEMLIGIINHRLTLSTVPNADPHFSDLETHLVPEISTTWIPTYSGSLQKGV